LSAGPLRAAGTDFGSTSPPADELHVNPRAHRPFVDALVAELLVVDDRDQRDQRFLGALVRHELCGAASLWRRGVQRPGAAPSWSPVRSVGPTELLPPPAVLLRCALHNDDLLLPPRLTRVRGGADAQVFLGECAAHSAQADLAQALTLVWNACAPPASGSRLDQGASLLPGTEVRRGRRVAELLEAANHAHPGLALELDELPEHVRNSPADARLVQLLEQLLAPLPGAARASLRLCPDRDRRAGYELVLSSAEDLPLSLPPALLALGGQWQAAAVPGGGILCRAWLPSL
jgi:hypothetical protein